MLCGGQKDPCVSSWPEVTRPQHGDRGEGGNLRLGEGERCGPCRALAFMSPWDSPKTRRTVLEQQVTQKLKSSCIYPVSHRLLCSESS